MKIACDVLPDLPPPVIKFYRANREIREDSRTNYGMMDNQAMMQIKKTRFTDEAKYSLTLEQDGIVVDKVTWSVFIKGNSPANRFLFVLFEKIKLSGQSYNFPGD